MIRLVINTIPLLGEQSGVGKYTREIAVRLAASRLYSSSYYYGYYSHSLPVDDEGANGTSFTRLIKAFVGRHSLLKRVCRKLVHLAASVPSGEHDVYFEPNFVLQPGIRARRRVVTVHDFSCLLYPQWHPADRVEYMTKHLWASLERADHIITVSEAMKHEAVERFGLDAARITAIPNGVDHSRYSPPSATSVQALRDKWRLPQQFVLFVGTIEPRKNLKNLLLAYRELPVAVQARVPLVIAGGTGWNNAEVHDLFVQLGDRVRLLGFVPEQDLPLLYGAATLFTYPSWYEGFGLPVLEAMACGCPVLTSDHAALREVCGDAAICVAPGDVDALRGALAEALEDNTLRERLQASGLRQAARYNWDESARKHGAVLQAVCKD